MKNDTEQFICKRLSGTTPSTTNTLRRSKSIRASFKILGSRWTQSSSNRKNNESNKNKNILKQRNDWKKDITSKYFAREGNEIFTDEPRETSAIAKRTSIKYKNSFFHSQTKEIIRENKIIYDIPKNVAPKAAALLEIPLPSYNDKQISNELKVPNFTFVKNTNEFPVNAKQTNLLVTLTTEDPINQKTFKTATIRRVPHLTHNQVQSKNLFNYCVI